MMPRKRVLVNCAAAAFAIAPGIAFADVGAQSIAPTIALDQSINLAWVLIGGFIVMFMQVGFALVETGFTRAKNAVNTMAMNLLVYPIGVMGFWLVGFVFMYGGQEGWGARRGGGGGAPPPARAGGGGRVRLRV